MDSVALFLIAIASIFLIGAIGEVIFQRTNVPDVIWLILAGILLGPILGLLQKEQLNAIAPYFAALTLVVVLFEGGTALELHELSHAARRSTLLAVVGFLASVFALAVLSMLAAWVGLLPEEWSWTHGWMFGAILGGSSSIIIMPAMAQARVAPKVANLINLESALTDAFCVVGTVALIDVMVKGSGGAAGPVVALLKSFGIGLVIGLVAGLVWMLFLRVLHSSEHAYPVTLAALLFLYVLIDHLGGSAALGILTVAVMLGNAKGIGAKIGLDHEVELDKGVRGVHRQLAFMIKSFFFVFIGAMLAGPISLLLIGVVFGLVLYAVRIPSSRLAMLGTDLTPSQKQLVAVAMPRGMAAGVLATLPVSAGVPGTETLPVIVFAAVFTSILVFAVGFPLAKRRMEQDASGAGALEATTGSMVEPAPTAKPDTASEG
jgi:cell volume regulation protein A